LLSDADFAGGIASWPLREPPKFSLVEIDSEGEQIRAVKEVGRLIVAVNRSGWENR
jgi:hypothetical protein